MISLHWIDVKCCDVARHILLVIQSKQQWDVVFRMLTIFEDIHVDFIYFCGHTIK